jgi:hypothetical protein
MGGKGSGKPKAALMKLDGTQTDLLGNVTETDFFKFLKLPSEHYADLEKTMTPEQALKFRNHIVRMKVGTSAIIPMLCGGPNCPVKHCPFHEGKNWPLSAQCPIESNLVSVWMKNYVDDLEVDPESRTELILVNQLVECDIIDYRANVALSVDEEAWSLLKIDVTTIADGVTNETTNPHPILEIKEKIQNRRLRVLESLSATRRERIKRAAALGGLEDGEIGAHWADLKAAAMKVSNINSGGTIEDLEAEKVENADWEEVDPLESEAIR